jgi:hypothetical protein
MEITKEARVFLMLLGNMMNQYGVSFVRTADGKSLCISINHDGKFEDIMFEEEITQPSSLHGNDETLESQITKVS